MSRDDFLAIRKAPRGRAGVFDVEALLMRDLKVAPEQKKVSTRSVQDAFANAVRMLFDGRADSRLAEMNALIQTLRHMEDLDPYVLAAATYLRLFYRGGLSQQNSPGSETLSPAEFQNPEIMALAQKILVPQKAKDPEKVLAVQADILAYYQMFFI